MENADFQATKETCDELRKMWQRQAEQPTSTAQLLHGYEKPANPLALRKTHEVFIA